MLECIFRYAECRIINLVPVQDHDMRTADPSLFVGITQHLFAIKGGVIAQGKEVAIFNQFRHIELEFSRIGRAIGQLHSKGLESFRP